MWPVGLVGCWLAAFLILPSIGAILGDAIVPLECRQEYNSTVRDWLFLLAGALLLTGSTWSLGRALWRHPGEVLPHAPMFRQAGVLTILASALVAVPAYYAVLGQAMISDTCGGGNESSYSPTALYVLMAFGAVLLIGVVLLCIGLNRGGLTEATVSLGVKGEKEWNEVDK